MIIESVELKNFLSHRESFIGLSTGINIIIGQNGSGKSSLFEAIKVAFYGPTETERKRLITYGETHAKIIVTFKNANQKYSIIRELELKKDKESSKSVTIYRNGTILAQGATQVSEELQKILGISKSAFINSVYVDQGELESLVNQSAAVRKDIFNEVIGLQFYDKAHNIIDGIIKDFTPDIQRAKSLKSGKIDILKEKEKTEEKLNGLELKKNENDTQIESKNRQLEQFRQELNKYQSKSDQLEKWNEALSEKNEELDQVNDLLKQMDSKNTEIEVLNKTKFDIVTSSLYKIGSNLAEYENLIKERNRNNEEAARINNTIKEIGFLSGQEKAMELQTLQIAAKADDWNRSEKTLKDLEEKEAEYKSETRNFQETRSKLEEKRRNKDALTEKLKNLGNLGSLTHKSVSEKIREIIDEIAQLNSNKGIVINEISTKRDQIKEIREKSKELVEIGNCPLCGQQITSDHLNKIKEQWNTEIAENEKEIQGQEGHLKAIETKLDRKKTELEVLRSENLSTFFSLRTEISDFERKISEYEKYFENNSIFHRNYEEAKKKLESLGNIRDSKAELEKQIASLNSKISTLNKEDPTSRLNELNLKSEELKHKIESMAGEKILFDEGKRISDYKAILTNLEVANQKLEQYMEAKNEFDRKREKKERLEEEIRKLENDNQLLAESLKGRSDTLEKFTNLNNGINDLRNEQSDLLSEIGQHKGSLKQILSRLDEINKELLRIDQTEKMYPFLGELKTAFSRDGIPQAIRRMALETITSQSRNIISRFNLGIEDVRISEDINVEIVQDGNVKNITQLSGGERTAISIAMRLAIARFLGKNLSTTILMDEPTIYLDEERRNDLKEILQYSLKELTEEGLFPQIIIITHHSELEPAADTSYSIRKESGHSIVEAIN